MEHSFNTGALAYSKGWYKSNIPYLERHDDLQNLKVILSYYTALSFDMITNKDIIYMLFKTSLPYWKECSEQTIYQYLERLINSWNEYKHSQHCSLEDFNLELEIVKTILSMLKMIPLRNQTIEVDDRLVEFISQYFKRCKCPKCSINYLLNK